MAKDPYLCTPTPRLPRRRHGCIITARCAQHPEGAVRVSDVRARQAKLRQIILERKAKQEQQEAAEAEERAAKEWEDVIRTNISGESGLRRPDDLSNICEGRTAARSSRRRSGSATTSGPSWRRWSGRSRRTMS